MWIKWMGSLPSNTSTLPGINLTASITQLYYSILCQFRVSFKGRTQRREFLQSTNFCLVSLLAATHCNSMTLVNLKPHSKFTETHKKKKWYLKHGQNICKTLDWSYLQWIFIHFPNKFYYFLIPHQNKNNKLS